MIRVSTFLTFLLQIVSLPAQPSPPSPLTSAEIAGRSLAEQLRDAVPAQNDRRSGVLKVRRGETIESIPIHFEVIVGISNWQAIYETTATHRTVAEKLTVVHAFDRPNEYLYVRGTNQPLRLTGEAAARPLAGTDFWLTDLGLEFYHWPKQRLLLAARAVMRKGRPCDTLESVNPQPGTNGIVRIVSWLDKETGGPIMAEAYDARNIRTKEFEVKGFKKIEGHWELQEMEIRSPIHGSRTRMEFNLKKD